MKNFVKTLFFASFTAAAALFITTCAEEKKESNSSENAYKGETLSVRGEQVWTRNQYTTKIKDVHLEHKGSHEREVIFMNPKIDPVHNIVIENKKITIGYGEIKNGLLSFDVNEDIVKQNLLEWEYLKVWFSRYWKNVKISNSGAKGDFFFLVTEYISDKDPVPTPVHIGIDREEISGTKSTITNETILYLYMDRNCVITGDTNSGYIDGQYYYFTEGDLNLSLKKGWNLIRRSETYSTDFSGSAYISMNIDKNLNDPDNYKWVIHLNYSF